MLPVQIGDGLTTLKLQVEAKAKPISEARSLHENSIEVVIQSRRTNSAGGIISIGNSRQQAYELTAGERTPTIRISRPSEIYFKGDATAVAAGDIIYVLIVTTTGRQRTPPGP